MYLHLSLSTLQGGDLTELINAGLPNVSGNFYVAGYSDAKSATDGAFAIVSQYLTDSHQNAGTSVGGTKINMNLSRDNAIYGASTTVQPPALSLIPQIRF